MCKQVLFVIILFLSGVQVGRVLGQGGPPPLPPPLSPPQAPEGNPITEAKINLGKALFWDEQLSSSRTVACGTCHQPFRGGVDPRAAIGSDRSTHPGPDGVFGNADDVNGSIGLPLSQADGEYDLDAHFGIREQVTSRYPPTMINAAYFSRLFWDGRAGEAFVDPVSGVTLLPRGAALETQAASPPVGSSEMAHQGRDWVEVADRVEGVFPLALAAAVPSALREWIAGRSYPALFAEVYGDVGVTPARIIMAIATYERSLFSDQSPLDIAASGGSPLSAAAQRGWNFFNGPARCGTCHNGSLLSDRRFHNIGIRPSNPSEDQGRFDVTGNEADRQKFKTPTLRNVALHGQFMHNGQFETLEDVLNFYARGGDFRGTANPGNELRPFSMSAGQRADLVAFLEALTDPRVAAEVAPFDRPALYLDSPRMPVVQGVSSPGSGGFHPRIMAIEPPLIGNPDCTIGVENARGGAVATLIINTNVPPPGSTIPAADSVFASVQVALGGVGAGNGYGSVPFPIPVDPALVGEDLFARWYVLDANADGGVAVSEVARLTVFPPPVPLAVEDVAIRLSVGGSRISISDLLANDIEGAQGGGLTVVALGQPVSGQAAVEISDGMIFYAPNPEHSGVDQFTYEVVDGSGHVSTGVVRVELTDDAESVASGFKLNLEPMNGGQMMMKFMGIPGLTYRIQQAESLTLPIQWQDAGSATADNLGVYELMVDTFQAPLFYRAVYP